MVSKGTGKKVKDEFDFDTLLERVGNRGKYQRNVLHFILVPICFFIGFNQCQLLFQIAIPRYWCHVPGRENTSYSQEEWIDLTIPKKNGTDKYDSCSKYNLHWIDDGNLTVEVTNDTMKCTDGWEYDQTQFWSTVGTSFGWYCEKETNSPFVLTINMAGNSVGTFLLPMMADRIGRRPMFFVIMTIHVVFTLAYIWVKHYGLHMAFRFFRGLIEMTVYYLPHVTVLEVLGPDDRAKATTISWVWWMGGMCITSLIAWLVPDWQYLALISCIPGFLGFMLGKFLPESPRWLLSKGKVSECTDMLMKIGETNGITDVSRYELETKLGVIASQQEKEVSFIEAFKHPQLRLRSIMIFIMSPSIYLVYGVTMFGISVLPDDQFLSHFILSLSELPSNGLGLAITQYLGRRVSFYLICTLTAICCLTTAFCTHSQWLMLVLLSLIKLLSTTGLFIMYVLTAEVFPTAIRSSGMGLMGVTGLIAMATAPSVMNTGYGPAFQYWVMFVLSVVSLLTSLSMPETLGLPLPQTFQEAEDISKGRPITKWIHHWNHKNFPVRKYSLVDGSISKEDQDNLKAMPMT